MTARVSDRLIQLAADLRYWRGEASKRYAARDYAGFLSLMPRKQQAEAILANAILDELRDEIDAELARREGLEALGRPRES